MTSLRMAQARTCNIFDPDAANGPELERASFPTENDDMAHPCLTQADGRVGMEIVPLLYAGTKSVGPVIFSGAGFGESIKSSPRGAVFLQYEAYTIDSTNQPVLQCTSDVFSVDAAPLVARVSHVDDLANYHHEEERTSWTHRDFGVVSTDFAPWTVPFFLRAQDDSGEVWGHLTDFKAIGVPQYLPGIFVAQRSCGTAGRAQQEWNTLFGDSSLQGAFPTCRPVLGPSGAGYPLPISSDAWDAFILLGVATYVDLAANSSAWVELAPYSSDPSLTSLDSQQTLRSLFEVYDLGQSVGYGSITPAHTSYTIVDETPSGIAMVSAPDGA